MGEPEWISVKDRLPLDNIAEDCCDEFLVTVELNNPDPNDDREVMFLWFDNDERVWLGPGGMIYERVTAWHVTDWAEKPKPASPAEAGEKKG